MKTKYWIAIISIILMVCLVLSFPLLMPGEDARYARIISNGEIVHTADLRIDRVIQISTPDGGQNTVTIQDGRIGVTAASCPDHYCMDRGMCSSGVQIVCLPNRLIIQFLGEQAVDSVAG